MKLSLIVARTLEDDIIGVNGQIPWKCAADMTLFKDITSGPNKAVVMGRNTWESLPKKPLPNRLNIVVTANPQNLNPVHSLATCMTHIDQVAVSPSIKDAIQYAKSMGVGELFFIGGKAIYDEAVTIVDEVHVSEMEVLVQCDPTVDKVTTFDYEFLWSDYDPDQSWVVKSKSEFLEADTQKRMFTYRHLVRK